MTANLIVKSESEIETISTKLGHKVINTLVRRFGCLFCYDKGSSLCSAVDLDNGKTDFPNEGICREKLMRIISLIPDYGDEKPTVSRVFLDISKSMGHKRLYRVYLKLEELERELDNTTDEEKKKDLLRAINPLKGELMYFMKQGVHYEDLQVGRETPKQVEVREVKKPSFIDIGEYIRKAEIKYGKKKIVDVEETAEIDEDE